MSVVQIRVQYKLEPSILLCELIYERICSCERESFNITHGGEYLEENHFICNTSLLGKCISTVVYHCRFADCW